MYKIIERNWENSTYDNKFFKYLKFFNNETTEVYLKYPELDHNPQLFTTIYFESEDKYHWPPKEDSIWLDKRFLSKEINRYYFGLCKDDDFYKSDKTKAIALKERLFLEINFETIEKSQLVFVKDDETLQINTCMRIDLSSLSSQAIPIFKNNFNVFAEDADSNHYLIILGGFEGNELIDNLKNVLSNIEFDNDGESPFIKVKSFSITSASKNTNNTDDNAKSINTSSITEKKNNENNVMEKNPDKKEKEAENSELENEPDFKSKLKLNDTLIKVLTSLKEGKSLEETSEILDINIYRINSWLKLGKQNISPYDVFYKQYNEIMPEKGENIDSGEDIDSSSTNTASSENDDSSNESQNSKLNGAENMSEESPESNSKGVKTKKELIEESCRLLKEGKSKEEICEILDIPESQMTNWYYLGKMNITPYDLFYKTKGNIETENNVETKTKENIESESNVKEENKDNTENQNIESKNKQIPMNKINNLRSSELDIILENNNLDYALMKNKDEKLDIIFNELSDDEMEKSLNLLEDIYSKRRAILKKLTPLSKNEMLRLLSKKDYKKFSKKNRSIIINHIVTSLNYKELDEFLDNLNKNIYIDIDTLNQKGKDNINNKNNDSYIESKENESSFNDSNIQSDSSNKDSKKFDESRCATCGKTLPNDYKKDKCKTCQRKEYLSKIIKDMLSHIDPEVEFTMEDFKKIGYTDLRIKDYVWTLQEFDLIDKTSEDKYCLKSEDILKQHILPDSDSKSEDDNPEDEKDNVEKLSKTCSVCGKTFSISHFHKSKKSQDGYEDYCKSCKKQVKAADYAEYLLRYVKPEQEFGIDEMQKNYPAREILYGQIWSLQEFGLINQKGDNYALVDEETLRKFMDSYLQENPDEKPKMETDTKEIGQEKDHNSIHLISKEEFDKLDKKNKDKFRKMEILINALKEGKDRKEAMKLAGVNISSIMAWNTLGSRGNELYVNFYNEYNQLVVDEDSNIDKSDKIKTEDEYKPKELHYNKLVNQKMNIVLKLLSEGKSKKIAYDAANVTPSIVSAWIRSGESGNDRYVKFYGEYNKITGKKPEKTPNTNSDKYYPHKYTPERHKIIIDAIKEGKTRKDAANLAKIDLNNLQMWYQKGKNGEQPFAQYYADYTNAREYAEKQKNSKEKSEDKAFESEEIQNKLGTFIEEIKNGKTRSESAETAELSLKDISTWITKGNQRKEPYVNFAEEYKSARDYSISNILKTKENIKSEVVDLIIKGKTLEEASKLANEGKSEKDILFWYNEGRFGNSSHREFYYQCQEASENNEKTSFSDKVGENISKSFNDEQEIAKSLDAESEITESSDEEAYGFNYSKETHKLVIEALKEGKSQDEAADAAGISAEDLNNWFVNAHSNPYYSFYMDYIALKTNAFGENEDKELAENKDKIVVFFNAIRLGKNRKQAAKIADLNLKLINKWISKGNQGKEPYVSIANEYKEARQSATSQGSDFNKKLKDEAVELIKNGKTLEEAAKLVNDGKNENDILNWYSAGKFGDKNHKEFYLQCVASSSDVEEDETIIPEFSDDETPQKVEESSKTEEIEDNSQDDKTSQKEEEIETQLDEKSSLKSFVINESEDEIEILIKGIIDNRDLISTLNGLKGFDECITKIVTNSVDNDKMDLLIEIKTTELNVNIIKKNLGILN